MAFAEFLDLDHLTLLQLSTSSAVVEGVFNGLLKVADQRRTAISASLPWTILMVKGSC